MGKVFHGDHLNYEFNLLPEDGHAFPAFINLQQPFFEKFLHQAIAHAQAAAAPIDIRGRNRVYAVENHTDHVALTTTTHDGTLVLSRFGAAPLIA